METKYMNKFYNTSFLTYKDKKTACDLVDTALTEEQCIKSRKADIKPLTSVLP